MRNHNSQPDFSSLDLSVEEIVKMLPFFNKMVGDKVIEHLKKNMNNVELPVEIRLKYSEIYVKILEEMDKYKKLKKPREMM
jgi:hypothetical protein